MNDVSCYCTYIFPIIREKVEAMNYQGYVSNSTIKSDEELTKNQRERKFK